ncbi:hypothetical protein PoB_000970400 [Plakobranchus ocellatus]|uniref:Uncharacterized protein n=1 Tax=Plakobranchus ocellatus TaxID=259542 RepID=A0AAV3YMA7_9GAST|nr:hypothetical protein PoB_000970400 [Plakobranchus ocellatus]
MGRSWRWPPVRHHIAEHTSACARSPWTSHPRYDKASPASNQADQKLIHMCIPIIGKSPSRPSGRCRSEHQDGCVVSPGLVMFLCEELGDQHKVRSFFLNTVIGHSSSLVHAEICRDSSVADSSPATGALPDRRPESLRSLCLIMDWLYTQTKPALPPRFLPFNIVLYRFLSIFFFTLLFLLIYFSLLLLLRFLCPHKCLGLEA